MHICMFPLLTFEQLDYLYSCVEMKKKFRRVELLMKCVYYPDSISVDCGCVKLGWICGPHRQCLRNIAHYDTSELANK